MIYIILLFLFSSVLLIIIGINSLMVSKVYVEKIIPDLKQKRSTFKIFTPLTNLSKLMVEKWKLGSHLDSKLAAAKIKKMSIYEFFALKIALSLLGAVLILVIFGLDILKVILAICFGYFLPEIWLHYKIKMRKQAIVHVLPETIDLLGLCIEAGLDFMMAIKWIIEKSRPNPLLEELALVSEEVKWGKPRSEALKDLAKRLNIPEVSSFVHTLVQSDRLGVPVSETFMILSEDTRQQRFRKGERFALTAPIKILIPLIFFILPVIAIVVGGPIILQFVEGGFLKLGG